MLWIHNPHSIFIARLDGHHFEVPFPSKIILPRPYLVQRHRQHISFRHNPEKLRNPQSPYLSPFRISKIDPQRFGRQIFKRGRDAVPLCRQSNPLQVHTVRERELWPIHDAQGRRLNRTPLL